MGDNVRLALRSLRSSKARSFLTMLGIIIGVAAVVLVVCIGQGVKQQIANQLSRYGNDVFVVRPGPPQSGGGWLTGLSGSNSGLLTGADLTTVAKAHGVKEAVPLSTVSGSVSGDYTEKSPLIIATTSDFADIINQPMEAGGFFDAQTDGKGVVLGSNIAKRLFTDNAPLGQALVWHGQRFMVAGVFSHFDAPPFSLEANFNDAVFVPYLTAQDLSGTVLGIYQIIARADGDVGAVMTGTNQALISAHNGSQDVNLVPAAGAADDSNQTIRLLTMLIAGAAILALLVGGVGIMNVMLVSVTERMYEIGLRKAIGATNQQIMRQFVAEAFVLSGFGAVLGVILSLAGVGLLRAYTSLQAVVVWDVLLLAPLLAIAVGLFFGSMPALKAARKDPIEALRHD
ncbi:MAG TPA: ABC transporter permease [Candidatus Saccharimonadales bacterium]|nr:ABC transporter permease [Candidatus Saccharimonadales bacterium]